MQTTVTAEKAVLLQSATAKEAIALDGSTPRILKNLLTDEGINETLDEGADEGTDESANSVDADKKSDASPDEGADKIVYICRRMPCCLQRW